MSESEERQQTYRVTSTSRQSAIVERQLLTLGDRDDRLTRKYIDPLQVDNPRNADATVKLTIGHQRRSKADGPWGEEPAFNFGTLPAGQQVRITLDSVETLSLYQHLTRLYRIADSGVHRGQHIVTIWDAGVPIATGTAEQIIRGLLEKHGEGVLELIGSLEPDLLTAAAVARQHALRRAAYEEFAARVEAGDWNEPAWQRFFEENTWIFGHGLDYRFLVTGQAQADYGGGDVTGRGGQQGDFLMHTEANARFSVLVEIKKPTSPLLGNKTYRNGAWLVSSDLAGGVAQIQANCDQWAREGSGTRANRRWLEERGISVIQPRGILLIGHTGHLDSDDKRETFERFRRNLWNPEVLTYDELLARARFLVEQNGDADSGGNRRDDEELNIDDIPF